jgi:hypothetical protein
VTGRDVPEGEYALTVREGSWTLNGSSLADAAKAAQQAKATEGLGDKSAEILAFVAQHPEGVTPKAVTDALGEPEARRYLARLADTGRLERPARGLYSTPPVPSVPMSQSQEWDNGTDGTPLCKACGTPLDAWLAAHGAVTHTGCDEPSW